MKESWVAGRDGIGSPCGLLTKSGWLVASLAGFLTAASSLLAQTPAATPVPPAAVTSVITEESIEAIRKQAVESTDLDSETKQKVEVACTAALDGLKRIAEAAGLAEQSKRDADNVAQRVADLRRRFAAMQGDQPAPDLSLTLLELEQEVSRREVALAELKAAQVKAESAPSTRVTRRREIRTSLLSASQRTADIQKQLDTAAPADEPALLTTARRTALMVARMVIEAEQPALQNELAKYDAEDAADFLRIDRDVRTREVTVASSELATLQSSLSRRRAADSAAALQRARDFVNTVPVPLASHAREIVTLAEAADSLSLPIETARRKLDATRIRLENLQKQFVLTEQRVKDVGLTGSIGAQLRRQRVSLPDLRRRRKNVQDRKTLIEDTQYKLFEYDDLRSESIDAAVTRMLKNVAASKPSERTALASAAGSVVEVRREQLDGVIRNHNTYLDTLFDLDATEQRLIRETERYEGFIDERVFWIRSNRLLFSSFDIDASDTWPLDQGRWVEVWRQWEKDVRSHPLIHIFAVLAFTVLLWQKRRCGLELAAMSQVARRGSCAQFLPTLRALYLTLILTLAWPGFVAFLAWRLNVSSNGSEFARAVANALLGVTWFYFPIEFFRRVCRKNGLAEAHFDWASATIAVFRTNLRWATLFGLVIVFAVCLNYGLDTEHGQDAVERIFFVAGTIALAVLIRRILRPQTGIFREYLARNQGGWIDQLKPVWYWGCVLAPLTVGGMTIAGYYYTALQLSWRFFASFVFVVMLQLLRAVLQRLLLVRRRAISIEQARERRAVAQAGREEALEPQLGPGQIVPPEDLQPDVAANTEQTRRMIRIGLIAASVVGLWLIWVDVLPALRILDQWPLWTTTLPANATVDKSTGPTPTANPADGKESPSPAVLLPADNLHSVTVADLGLAIFIAFVTFVCARNVPGLMEISVLQRLPLDNSVRYAVTTLTRYVIVLLGVILAFNAIAVGWSKVQWLATALTFGLAFGLQEIFANFVAGLILLFERPIRVGDVVTVDEVSGVVSRIRIRATTITNWDRKEYVIPNKEFIIGRMLNWTLSDKTNRIVINLGVAYGSDIEQAKGLLLKTCNDHPFILKDPPTVVTFEGFGDNSLNLVVRTFLPNLDNRLAVIDALHTEIDRAFRQAGIEIAFPQRDLHLRSVDPAILAGLPNN